MGGTTAGTITIGTQNSSDVATTIITAFALKLAPERELLAFKEMLRGDFLGLSPGNEVHSHVECNDEDDQSRDVEEAVQRCVG